MSRPVKYRYLVSGTMVAQSPLHVGGLEGNPATDMPLSINGTGELYIPGTSLAGPLRHWLVKNFCEKDIRSFWGWIPTRGSNESGSASYVSINDVKIGLAEEIRSEIRDGVGIDREFGTAADAIKFDREILPKGTRLPIEIALECEQDEGGGRGEMRALLEALGAGRIRLGAAKTRGLGRVKLDGDWQVETFGLYTPDGVLALLEHADPSKRQIRGLDELGDVAAPADEDGRLLIQVDWTPLGPVMVRASDDGAGIDMMPLTTDIGNGKQAPVMTGASAKGAMRNQSERILSTVREVPVDTIATGRQRFLGQLTRLPLIETLYGAVKRRDDKSQAGRGALSIDDCIAKISLSADEWLTLADEWRPDGDGFREEEQEEDAQQKPDVDGILAALEQQSSQSFDVAAHVAIDRWAGGGADRAFYAAAETMWPWHPLCLEVDVARLVPCGKDSENGLDEVLVRKAAIALFLLTLRDVVEGRVPLGFGVNRGYGDVSVSALSFMLDGPADAPDWLKNLNGLAITKGQDGRATFTDTEMLTELDTAWKDYLKQQENEPSLEVTAT